jgi:hypothetical protein
MEEISSEETAQKQAVWRQGGNTIKDQMETLMPDLSKITKVGWIPRWWLEGGSRKRASYSEILGRHQRHTLQA